MLAGHGTGGGRYFRSLMIRDTVRLRVVVTLRDAEAHAAELSLSLDPQPTILRPKVRFVGGIHPYYVACTS